MGSYIRCFRNDGVDRSLSRDITQYQQNFRDTRKRWSIIRQTFYDVNMWNIGITWTWCSKLETRKCWAYGAGTVEIKACHTMTLKLPRSIQRHLLVCINVTTLPVAGDIWWLEITFYITTLRCDTVICLLEIVKLDQRRAPCRNKAGERCNVLSVERGIPKNLKRSREVFQILASKGIRKVFKLRLPRG